MAIFIRNTHDLLSLSVGLTQSRGGSAVRFRLYRGRELLHELREPADNIGVPRSLMIRRLREEPIPEELPGSLLTEIDAAARAARQGTEPLWLLLERSTPHLGALPWERMLRRQINFPILRVPNIAVDPIFHSGELNLIVCASSPRAKSSFDVGEAVMTIANAALDSVPAGCRIHVFCDQNHYGGLQGRFDHNVTLYDPRDAAAYSADLEEGVIATARDGLVSPWLRWMADTLRGVTVDAVHFICPGFFRHDQGALALAQSPTFNENRRWSHFVGVDELTTFLDRVGAWSLGLSAPRHDLWVIGLRLLAESLTYSRPGPVLLDDFGALPGLDPLDATFRFLYGDETHQAPDCHELTLYCHPRRLEQFADPDADLLTGDRHPAIGSADAEAFEWAAAQTRSLQGDIRVMQATGLDFGLRGHALSAQPETKVARRANRLVLDRAVAKYAKMTAESAAEDRAEGAADAIRFVAELLGEPEPEAPLDFDPRPLRRPPDEGAR